MKNLRSGLLLFTAGCVLFFACARLNHPAAIDGRIVSKSQIPAESKAQTPGEPSQRRLRVATYNVHMESAPALAGVIRANANLNKADVLLLQEIESHDSEGASRAGQVADALDMNFAYAPGYQLRSGGSHGVAILSRFPLRDLEVIELPYFHVVVNSARRVALGATIDVDGQAIRIYSVHLDNRINPNARARQIAPVLKASGKFEGAVVIAGDLNTSPFCWAGNLMPIPCGLQDNAMEKSARAHGLDSPVAETGPTSTWLAMKLDAIYIRGLHPKARAVEGRVRLSDHLPMWLDLQLPDA